MIVTKLRLDLSDFGCGGEATRSLVESLCLFPACTLLITLLRWQLGGPAELDPADTGSQVLPL